MPIQSPGAAWVAVGTDANVCRHPYLNDNVSQFVPLYAYEFADRNAPWYFPPLNFPHGAAHTIDIQFLFPDWHGGPLGILHKLSPQERVLSGQLVTAWTNFMYTGNPNLKGDQPWPRYTKDSQIYLSQNVPRSSSDRRGGVRCRPQVRVLGHRPDLLSRDVNQPHNTSLAEAKSCGWAFSVPVSAAPHKIGKNIGPTILASAGPSEPVRHPFRSVRL